MQGTERPLVCHDFFNEIPLPMPGLRPFPNACHVSSPMAQKRHPNKTLMNHVFFVHQMSGCLVGYHSTF